MDNQTITIPKDKTCVYQHLVDGDVVYVGMGNYSRPLSMSGRGQKWHKVVNSGRFEVVIVKWFDDRRSASDYEINMIMDLSPLLNTHYAKEYTPVISRGTNKIQSALIGLSHAGWNDHKIAKALGTSQPTINRIKTGATKFPRYELAVEIIALHKRINSRAVA